MNDTLLDIAIPYTVEFKRRRRRTVESAIVWDEGTASIRTVTDYDADVAYRVRNGRAPSSFEYIIRSFDGRLWWPAFDGGRPMTLDAFVSSARDPRGYLLAAMNLSPSTAYSSRHITTEHFDDDVTVRRIFSSTKSQRWAIVNRAASRVLFCGDSVYLEGGAPAYFGTFKHNLTPLTLSMEVGRLVPKDRVAHGWLPGLIENRRRNAARHSLVFRAEEMDEHRAALEREGMCLLFDTTITVCLSHVDGPDSSEVCADVLARDLLGRNRIFAHQILGTSLVPSTGELLPRHLSREIIDRALTAHPPASFEEKFGIKFELAQRAISRLDERFPETHLSREELELLGQLA